MTEQFFEKPILNSPYAYPARHWELDADGQPTNRILDFRRTAKFVTPVPKPKKRRRSQDQQLALVLDEGEGISTAEQQYDTTGNINAIRRQVDLWRQIPDPSKWGVTPETQRLLQHWRGYPFQGIRPFFCQVEAVETAIWLAEVAPSLGARGKEFLDLIQRASERPSITSQPSGKGSNRLAQVQPTCDPFPEGYKDRRRSTPVFAFCNYQVWYTLVGPSRRSAS